MSLVQHNVCKLKDGRELNFDSRCNYVEVNGGFAWFYAINPENKQRNLLLQAVNVEEIEEKQVKESDRSLVHEAVTDDEIARIIHEFPADLYDEIMKPLSKIAVPEKKIITP